LRDPTFSRFSRTPTCDRQTDRHTTTAKTRDVDSVARLKNHHFWSTNWLLMEGLPHPLLRVVIVVSFYLKASSFHDNFNHWYL